jgi:hypothetical protein
VAGVVHGILTFLVRSRPGSQALIFEISFYFGVIVLKAILQKNNRTRMKSQIFPVATSKQALDLSFQRSTTQKALVFSVASWQNPPESLMNEISPRGKEASGRRSV